MIHKFHLKKVLREALPPVLRTDSVLQWLDTLTKPLDQDNVTFNSDQDSIADRMKHTGQKLMMEHYINTNLDLSGHCYFSDETIQDVFYIYTDTESPLSINYLYTDAETGQTNQMYFYTDEEVDNSTYSAFRVVMYKPDYDKEDTRNAISYWVNYYKAAGKTFTIYYYE